MQTVSYSSSRVISASGWIGASVLVQLLLLQLHTNLLQQLERKKEKERELEILNGPYKYHIFRLLPDYSNTFFVLAVNPLYIRLFFLFLSLSFCPAQFVADRRCLHDVSMLCPAAQYAIGEPCNLSIDIRHNLLQANIFYKKKSFPVAAFNLRSIECNHIFLVYFLEIINWHSLS